MRSVQAAALFGSLLTPTFPALAQCKAAKLSDADPWMDEKFGTAVDFSGDLLAAGAPDDGFGVGAVYAYQLMDGAWALEVKLAPDDGVRGTEFGAAVSVSSAAFDGGDLIAVGEPRAGDGNESGVGAVYVYRWDGSRWIREARLVADDGRPGNFLGVSVSVHSDHLAVHGNGVSVRGDRVLAGTAGADAAYVFHRGADGAWRQEARLPVVTSDDPWQFVALGEDPATGELRALVGMPAVDAARVFRLDGKTWVFEADLTGDDTRPGDAFGFSAALCGDVAAVGAALDGDLGEYAGSAYVFRRDGDAWRQEAKLLAGDGGPRDHFGVSAACDGDVVAVGSLLHPVKNAPGRAFVFQKTRSAWLQVAKLNPKHPESSVFFGYSTALVGEWAVVGDPLYDDPEPSAGAAFVHRLPECRTACTGGERIARARCKPRRDGNRLSILLRGGRPGDSFLIELPDGTMTQGILDSQGRATVQFRGLSAGEGTALAVWGCGAETEGMYSCP